MKTLFNPYKCQSITRDATKVIAADPWSLILQFLTVNELITFSKVNRESNHLVLKKGDWKARLQKEFSLNYRKMRSNMNFPSCLLPAQSIYRLLYCAAHYSFTFSATVCGTEETVQHIMLDGQQYTLPPLLHLRKIKRELFLEELVEYCENQAFPPVCCHSLPESTDYNGQERVSYLALSLLLGNDRLSRHLLQVFSEEQLNQFKNLLQQLANINMWEFDRQCYHEIMTRLSRFPFSEFGDEKKNGEQQITKPYDYSKDAVFLLTGLFIVIGLASKAPAAINSLTPPFSR